MINIIPRKKRQSNDIEFADHHRNAKSYVQRHITKGKPSLVKLLGRLYDNMDSDDDLSIDNSNSKNDDIALVLLGLFVPWERLPDYFKESEATESTIPSLCWDIWCKCRPTLDAHVQYYATNLLQMRKSRLEARVAAEARAENNRSDPGENLLGNKTLDNIIEYEDSLRDLGILNNECL